MSESRSGRPLAYSAEEAANLLRVSSSTIRSMVASGKLPRVPGMGRTVRIPSRALYELVGEPVPPVLEPEAIAAPEPSQIDEPWQAHAPRPARIERAPGRPSRPARPSYHRSAAKPEAPIRAGEKRFWLLGDSAQHRLVTWHVGIDMALCGKSPGGRWTKSTNRYPRAAICPACLTAVSQIPEVDFATIPIGQVAMIRQTVRGETVVLRKVGWHTGDGRKTACNKKEGPWYLTERRPSPAKMCFECREWQRWQAERVPGAIAALNVASARWSILLDADIESSDIEALIGKAPGVVVLRRANRHLETVDLAGDWWSGLHSLFVESQVLARGTTAAPNFDPAMVVTANANLLAQRPDRWRVQSPDDAVTWLTPIIDDALKVKALRARWDREAGPKPSR